MVSSPYNVSINVKPLRTPSAQKPIPFATFWHGDALSPYEWICLKSFSAKHKDVYLFSYDERVLVPEGIKVINASEVCDKELLGKFIYFGNVSLAGFTDYLRYKMIEKFGFCWFDADMICLSADNSGLTDCIFGFEHADSINNALLKLPQGHKVLLELIQTCEGNIGKDLEWGALGPILLTRLLTQHGLRSQAQPASKFYPINVVNFWQLLLPKYRDKVFADTGQSWSVHLWNELYKQIANWKQICPPAGSYVHAKAKELDCLGRFIAIYPETVINNVIEVWISNYERKVFLSKEIERLKKEPSNSLQSR